MDRPTRFFRLNLLYLVSLLGLFFFSASAFSDPVYGIESCSKSSGDCYQDDTANGWANTSTLDGWATSDIQGWYANETADYRFDISLPAAGDATTYYIRVEQDHLQNGVVGVDLAKDFYVGTTSGAGAGQMTKHCTAIPGGSSLPTLPYQGDECVVAGPTFTGVDDDGDGRVDEEVLNGIDDDGDGLIDEDPMPDCASSTGAQHIQYTAAVHFDPDEAGSSTSNWALYWLGHLAVDSSNFPGGSVETRVRAHREGDPNDPPNQCPTTPNVPVADAPPVYCDGAVATIVGTSSGDTIIGTSGNDVIFGLGGDDTIHGKGGNDTLCGGDGVDNLYGDDGADVVDGGLGDDWLFGGAGDDQLFGGDGNDLMYGSTGNDQLYGGAGNDKVYGQEDDDVLHGGTGDDYLYADIGNDQLFGDAGVDHLWGADGDDTLDGGTEADVLYGGSGNDNLAGGDGDDVLKGAFGDDNMDGGNGTDACYGGGDTDTATNCETVGGVP